MGIELATISRYPEHGIEGGKKSRAAIHHGREEWLLKWLLKMLDANVEPRYASLSGSEATL